MNNEDRIIGEWIAEKRQKAGMTQSQLGERIGMKKNSICQYEKGTRSIAAAKFLELCRVLNADPTELTVIR